jgi:tetratricopeptide (TPR) repeat protein
MDPAQRAWAPARADALAGEHPDDAGVLLAAAGVLLDAAAEGGPGTREAALKQALRLMHGATALRPDDATPWLNLADVAGRLGADTLARQCLDAALRAESADLGAFLVGLPSDPAFALWRRALAEGRAAAPMLRAIAATRLAAMDLASGDAARAADLAEAALPDLPGVPAPYVLAAGAAARLGRPAAAATALRAALALNPFDGTARTEAIAASHEAGDHDGTRMLAAEGAALFSACPAWAELAAGFRRGAVEN